MKTAVILLAGVLAAAANAAATSIATSCHDFAVSDAGILAGTCGGSGTATTIDLNRCLVNDIGFLRFRQDGNLTVRASCIGCSITPKGYRDSTFVMCSCVDYRTGIRHSAGVDLNLGVVNDDGVFSCFGVKGQ